MLFVAGTVWRWRYLSHLFDARQLAPPFKLPPLLLFCRWISLLIVLKIAFGTTSTLVARWWQYWEGVDMQWMTLYYMSFYWLVEFTLVLAYLYHYVSTSKLR